jgi:Tfp pilus assembly protein PilV
MKKCLALIVRIPHALTPCPSPGTNLRLVGRGEHFAKDKLLKKRAGFTILETIVAAILLAAMMTACLQLLGVTAQQRRAVQERQAAIREAGNVMEQVTAISLADLNQQHFDELQSFWKANSQLPGGELKIESADSPGPPTGKRINVTIRWQDRAGQWTAPVRLVSWKFGGDRG